MRGLLRHGLRIPLIVPLEMESNICFDNTYNNSDEQWEPGNRSRKFSPEMTSASTLCNIGASNLCSRYGLWGFVQRIGLVSLREFIQAFSDKLVDTLFVRLESSLVLNIEFTELLVDLRKDVNEIT